MVRASRRAPYPTLSKPEATLSNWGAQLRGGDILKNSDLYYRQYEPEFQWLLNTSMVGDSFFTVQKADFKYLKFANYVDIQFELLLTIDTANATFYGACIQVSLPNGYAVDNPAGSTAVFNQFTYPLPYRYASFSLAGDIGLIPTGVVCTYYYGNSGGTLASGNGLSTRCFHALASTSNNTLILDPVLDNTNPIGLIIGSGRIITSPTRSE